MEQTNHWSLFITCRFSLPRLRSKALGSCDKERARGRLLGIRERTMLSKKGQRAFKDYSALQKPVQELLATGKFQITACEACAEARGYHKEDTLEGCKRHSMDWYSQAASVQTGFFT